MHDVPTAHSANSSDCAAIAKLRNWELKLRPSGMLLGVGHISIAMEPM